MISHSPKTIAFEGLDGAGKSTLINNLKIFFEKNHKDFSIRTAGSILRHDENKIKGFRLPTELLALKSIANSFSSALNYYNLAYNDALTQQFKFILLDRYNDSFFVRQMMSWEEEDITLAFYNLLPKPDITVFINTSLENSFKRVTSRDGQHSVKKSDLNRLIELYTIINSKNCNNFIEIDGNQSEEHLMSQFITKFKLLEI